MGSNGHSLCVKVGYSFDELQALHIEAAETQDAREGSMSSELTQEQVSTLVARGWWYTDAYIGGRGYVQRVTDGTHVYEQGGVNYWWRVR